MLLSPFRPEIFAQSGEPFAYGSAIDDPIDAEVPEVGSELAPGRKHDDLDVVEKREGQIHGLGHTRAEVARWVEDYNTERPHSALGYQTPAAFARQLTTATDRHAALHEGYAQRSVAPPALNGVSTERTLLQAG